MTGINQVQVNRDVGLDFAAGLRSILRQAPNIVMIGEIVISDSRHRHGGRANRTPCLQHAPHQRCP